MPELDDYKSILSKCRNISIMFLKSNKLSQLLIEYQAFHNLPVSLPYGSYDKDNSIDSIHACALSIYRNIDVNLFLLKYSHLNFN